MQILSPKYSVILHPYWQSILDITLFGVAAPVKIEKLVRFDTQFATRDRQVRNV